METQRTEAFSDGVFAVAITLLVVTITVPDVRAGQLGSALRHMWPAYISYLVSFATIGIIWVNHHTMYHLIERVDRRLLFLNLLFLTTVVFIPFPSELVGRYVGSTRDASIAVAIYGFTMTAMGVTFALMWIYVVTHADLVAPNLDKRMARAAAPRFAFGTFVYALTIGLAWWNPKLCVLIYAALAVYYVFNQLSPADNPPPATPTD